MSQKIEELYSDEKYNLAIYYLKESGILLTEDLVSFNFDELMFVPGVSGNLILEMQAMFQRRCSSGAVTMKKEDSIMIQSDFKPAVDTNEFHFITTTAEAELASTNDIPPITDARIADVYSCVPRSAPFVHSCNLQGKTLMSQLSCEDFEQALSLKGLGISSVETLHNIYQQYINGEYSVAPYNENIMFKGLEDISIEQVFSNIPHGGLFIRHCQNIGIKSIADLKDFNFDVAQVRGIGITSMERIQQAYLEVLSLTLEAPQEPVILKDVPIVNMGLSIKFLKYAGVSEANIKILNENRFLTVKDLCQDGLTPYYYSLIRNAVPFLKTPVTTHFLNQLENLKESSRKSLIKRIQGNTLQQIADEIGITRERVRQIIAKACLSLIKSADMVADILMNDGKNVFTLSDLQHLFPDSDTADCCKYVLLDSNEVQYLSFSDKLVRKTLCPDDLDCALQKFSADVIGEGMNFYDNLENIESELSKYGLEFLGFEDIMNYLVKTGYHFYGDYVAKGNQSYAFICYDAVSKYFSFDIKLDSDENNEDMRLLRKVVDKHYHGLSLPENNRALTARIASILILSGRGRYCPIEKAIFNTNLFEEVYSYIQESEQTSFYYTELFTRFQGRFLAETNISNANFLHGILKYLYPDDFNYERDLLVKNGAARQDINDRLCDLIIANKGAMTKSEIKKAIPGLNDFVIASVVARVPKLIQWEYNIYNHIGNISYNSNDFVKLNQLLAEQLKKHNGYLSDTLLFNAVKLKYSQFIEKNKITNSLNLYYIIGYLFEKEYRFRRPHILSCDFPVKELTIANIAKALLGCDTILHYPSYMELAESLGWAEGTLYSVFTEIERDFIRISEDDYVYRDTFNFTDDLLREIQKQIAYLVEPSGYYALSSIFSFNSFPNCSYKWNGFLLESIIEEYEIGFKIINPQVRDRRYQRGIVVQKNAQQNSFEDLVMALIKKDSIAELTEIELQKYLKNKGLITNLVPQELYKYSALLFKNGQFTVRL